MAPNIDELNATTLKLLEVQVEDNLFKGIPFFRKLKEARMKPFSAGTLIQNTFLYDSMVGGAYSEGDTFNIDVVDILAATQFRMKKYEVNVSEFLSRIHIENGSGDLAKIKIIDAKMAAAVETMSRMLAIAASRHGQAISGDNRIKHINGASEAMNDGVTNSWDGNVFTTYGGETRTAVGGVISSVPAWLGDATGAPGSIGYAKLVEGWMDTMLDNVGADIIRCNKFGSALMLEKFQTQQRFQQEEVPVIGMQGFKLMGGHLVIDEYCPSKVNGVNDTKLGNYLTANFTSGSAPASSSNLPTSTTIQPNEVIEYYSTETWDYYVATSALYGGGFTGFKVAQDSDLVAGQHLLASNLLCRAPRRNKQMYGFNS